jgi:hypothetical protein
VTALVRYRKRARATLQDRVSSWWRGAATAKGSTRSAFSCTDDPHAQQQQQKNGTHTCCL